MTRLFLILAALLLRQSGADAQEFTNPLVRQAVGLCESGDTTGAVSMLRSALSIDPLQPEAYAQLGTIYLRSRRPDSALAVARAGLRLYPANVTMILLDGEALTGVRQFDEALAQFDRIEQQVAARTIVLPDAQQAMLRERIASLQQLKGMEALRDGDFRRAQEWFSRAIERDSSSLELHRLRTYAAIAAADWRGAVRSAEQGLRVVGPDTSLLRMKSKAHYELQEHAALAASAEQLLKLKPNAVDIHLLYADALFLNEKVLEGLAALNKALVRFPRERTVYQSIIQVHRQRNDFKGIATILSKEHEQFPDDQAVLVQLGEIYEIMNEWDSARRAYDLLGQLTRDSVVVDLLKARTYERQDSLAGAIRQYRTILQRSPNQPDALWGLGNVYDRQERWTEAYDQYRLAVGARPSSEVRVRLGWVLEQLRRPAEAAEQYSGALDQGSTDPLPHYRLAIMCKDTAAERSWELARTAFRKALTLINQSQQNAVAETRTQDSLHYVDTRRERVRQDEISALTESIFRHMEKTYPPNEVEGFLLQMSDVYASSGRLRYFTGQFYRGRGDTSQALRYLEDAARLSPSVAEIHTSLGEMYESRARWNDARVSYERALAVNDADSHTYAALIRISERESRLNDLCDRWVARYRARKDNAALWTAVIEALNKAGRLEEAAEIARDIKER